MSTPQGVSWLWPTPLYTRTLLTADRMKPDLLALAARLREADGATADRAWASTDDLYLHREPRGLTELADAVRSGVADAAARVNQAAWAQARPAGLRVDLVGMWMQASNRYARHDVHNHGNCSWSGVYYVDVDPTERRTAHPDLGEANGMTRLHSPLLDRLGGAYMDLGAAWLQDSHVDLDPEPGLLVIWPSFLLHQVLPYDGDRDRVIVSFNATIHGPGGGPGFGF